MASTSRRLRFVFFTALTICALALLAAYSVVLLYPDDWRPVEATVQASHIKRTRPGTLQWSLLVEATYDVSGRRYATTVDIFHDPELAVTEARAKEWPAGRAFTLFYDPNNPRSRSLVPDGGREAMAVMAAVLTPLVVFVIGFVVFVVRRARARDDGDPPITAG